MSKEVGRIDNFRFLARKLSLKFSPNRVRYFLYTAFRRYCMDFRVVER